MLPHEASPFITENCCLTNKSADDGSASEQTKRPPTKNAGGLEKGKFYFLLLPYFSSPLYLKYTEEKNWSQVNLSTLCRQPSQNLLMYDLRFTKNLFSIFVHYQISETLIQLIYRLNQDN